MSTVTIADKGEVVLGAKLVPTGGSAAVSMSIRGATDVGVSPPAPPPIATASNKGVSTPAAVGMVNVVLRVAIALIDLVEDVDQDAVALQKKEAEGRKGLRAQLVSSPAAFFASLKKQPAAGETVIAGGGAHDLIVSLPYQASGIRFDGTLTLRDLSGQHFDAKLAISITSEQPPPFLIVMLREVNRPGYARSRSASLGKELYWYDFSLTNRTSVPIADGALELVIDAPEEGYRRQRLNGTTDGAGRAVWTIDGRHHQAIAVPEKVYLVLRGTKDGYVSRNFFVFPKSGARGSSSSPNAVAVVLWPTADVGAALKSKSFNIDSGHGIAYAGDQNKARVQEWYVCDLGLQRARKTLIDWGVPPEQIQETRTAGILFDEYYWKLDFGKKTDSPRIYTASVNPARGRRFVDDLANVLALDTPAMKQDFLNRNHALLNAEAEKLVPLGPDHKPLSNYIVGAVQWNGDQLVAPLDDGSGSAPTLTRLKEIDHLLKLEFGRHDQRDIFANLVEKKLADQTMDICLRWNGRGGEITGIQDAVEPANWNRDYIKRRMVAQVRQEQAFDYHSSTSTAWMHSVHPPVLTPPQSGEAKRPNTAGEWNAILLGWTAGTREQYWRSLRPHYNGTDGLIVTLHLNADDTHSSARGCHTEYDNTSGKIFAQLMAKYVDPLEGGMRSKTGFGAKTGGKTFFDSQATDVFLEVDFQNSVLGNFSSKRLHKETEHARWVWFELLKPDSLRRLGDSIAEAIAEGFCYAQNMSDW